MFSVLRRSSVIIALALLYHADPAQAGTVWYQGAVQLIYPFNDGSFAVGVPTSLPLCLGSGSGSYLFVVPNANAVTADGAKNMLATVLMAFALGKTISVAYDDSSSSCYVNRLLIQ
jgi:hypothetical protein